jgi:hypothetical protein
VRQTDAGLGSSRHSDTHNLHYHRHRPLLRARRERLCHCAAEQRDEIAPLHPILVIARGRNDQPIGGAPATVAARAATSTIPIVFNLGADPIGLGLVTNLNRPCGNITGIAMMTLEIETKRLELLHELAPPSTSVAVLLNPSNVQTQTWRYSCEKGYVS